MSISTMCQLYKPLWQSPRFVQVSKATRGNLTELQKSTAAVKVKLFKFSKRTGRKTHDRICQRQSVDSKEDSCWFSQQERTIIKGTNLQAQKWTCLWQFQQKLHFVTFMNQLTQKYMRKASLWAQSVKRVGFGNTPNSDVTAGVFHQRWNPSAVTCFKLLIHTERRGMWSTWFI